MVSGSLRWGIINKQQSNGGKLNRRIKHRTVNQAHFTSTHGKVRESSAAWPKKGCKENTKLFFAPKGNFEVGKTTLQVRGMAPSLVPSY